MAEFVDHDGKQIDVGARLPGLLGVEVHVSGERFADRWIRVKGVGEGLAGAVKGVVVAMRSRGEQQVDVAAGARGPSWSERDLRRLRPFGEGALGDPSDDVRRQAVRQAAVTVAQNCCVAARPVPAVADRCNVLPGSGGSARGVQARDYGLASNQFFGEAGNM